MATTIFGPSACFATHAVTESKRNRMLAACFALLEDAVVGIREDRDVELR